MIPVVRFSTGKGEIVRAIGEREFSIELGEKKVAQRLQLPLKLVGFPRDW